MKKLNVFLKKLAIIVIFGLAIGIIYKCLGRIDKSILMTICIIHFILIFVLCFFKKAQKSFLYLIISFIICISLYVSERNGEMVINPYHNTCNSWCFLNGNYDQEFEQWKSNWDKNKKDKITREEFCTELCKRDAHFTGSVKRYRKNGKLFSEYNYIDGKPTGISRTYHNNGQINTEDIDTETGIIYKQYKKDGTLDLMWEYNKKD